MQKGLPLVNLQVKTSADTFAEFENAYSESECTTKGQFLEAVIESYLNPPKGKTIEVSLAEDLATIQNLTNEIGRLKIEIDLKNDANDETCILLQAAKEALHDIQDELENNRSSMIIPLDRHLITIPPIVKKVLEIEAETAKRKSGKDFSIEEILLNSFWDSILFGRVSPFRQWSSSELSQLKKQLQA